MSEINHGSLISSNLTHQVDQAESFALSEIKASADNSVLALVELRLNATQSIGFKLEQLAGLSREIAHLFEALEDKTEQLHEEQSKAKPNPNRIAQLEGELSAIRREIGQKQSELGPEQQRLTDDIKRLSQKIAQIDHQISVASTKNAEGPESDEDRARLNEWENEIRAHEEKIRTLAGELRQSGRNVEEALRSVDAMGSRSAQSSERISEERLAVIWSKGSFESMSTGEAIQLMAWMLKNVGARSTQVNKYIGLTAPNGSGLPAAEEI